MYTSWNHAYPIVHSGSFAIHFWLLFFLEAIAGSHQPRKNKSPEGLNPDWPLMRNGLPLIILIVSCGFIYARLAKLKVWRGELSKIESYSIGFNMNSSILTYFGVIFNLIVCCFGTIREVYLICHFPYMFMNFSMPFFVSPPLQNIVMNTEMHKKHLRFVLTLHVAGIIVLPLLTQPLRTRREISAIFINQIIFMFYSWHIADYLSYRDGGLEFRESEIERIPNDIDYESDDEEDSTEFYKSTGSLCGVCFRSYCESIEMRTPRILNKCGHTTCQQCAGEMLKSSRHPSIQCPFCRKKTRVDSVNRLPKNYGLLEVINDINRLDEFHKSSATEYWESQRRERRNSF